MGNIQDKHAPFPPDHILFITQPLTNLPQSVAFRPSPLLPTCHHTSTLHILTRLTLTPFSTLCIFTPHLHLTLTPLPFSAATLFLHLYSAVWCSPRSLG
jgi:hypothetical protein